MQILHKDDAGLTVCQMRETRKRVLVVEDEALVAIDLESQLHRLGHCVVGTASSAEEAIERIENTHPDLVLMDIRIKGPTDGVHAAQQIRDRFALPVIYLTAHTDRETLERAKLTEPFAFLAKPVTQASLGASIEISLHKHAMDREVRRREAWLSTTVRSVGSAMIVTDAEGRVMFINDAAVGMTGCAAQAALGNHVSQVAPLTTRTGTPCETDLVRLAIFRQRTVALLPNLRLRTPLGTERKIEGQIAPSFRNGVPVGAVLTFTDVTDREREHVRNTSAEVARAVGRLSAAASKDLSDSLTVILGSADRLQQSLSDSDPLHPLAREIRGAGASVAQLTTRLTQLAREELTHPATLSLKQLLHDASAALARSLPAQVSLQIIVDADTPEIFADPNQIRQLLNSLVSYAAASMPAGGNIVIEASRLLREPGQSSAAFARLTVRYDGVYMDPREIEQLFAPSLGVTPGARSQRVDLFVVLSILTDLGGHVSAISSHSGKNTFEVLLPEHCQEELPSFLEDESPSRHASAVLMLVEPDAEIRGAVSDCLQQSGYCCLQAIDYQDALFIEQLYGGSVDLVVGALPVDACEAEAMSAIFAAQPRCRMLVSSMQLPDAAHPALTRAAGWAFLQQPYPSDALLKAVANLLATGNPSAQD